MPRHVQLSVLADHVMKVQPLDSSSLEHVDSCPHCRSDLRWLEDLGALRKFEPPNSAVAAVLRAYKSKKWGHAA
jgi:hypothetical protein